MNDPGAAWLQRRRVGGRERSIYVAARHKVADRQHRSECARCSVDGKPAATGSQWLPRHQHAYALAIVNKEIGVDRWQIRVFGAITANRSTSSIIAWLGGVPPHIAFRYAERGAS